MAKETKLKDDAFIYQKDEKKSERQKWNDLHGKQKLQYFMDYYLKISLIVIVSLVVVGSFIYTIFLRNEPKTVLYAAVMDSYDDISKENLITEFSQHLALDQEKQVILDDTYFPSNEMAMGMGTVERLTAYIMAKQVDVIITSAEDFEQMAYSGHFVDLTEQLPTELYTYFSDSMYQTMQHEDSKERPYGIYLKDSERYKAVNNRLKDPVIGIVINSKYKENANEFLKYLFEIE